jgi:uncharacterized protein (DUF58 family)
MSWRAAGLLVATLTFSVASEVADWDLLGQIAMALLALLLVSFLWSRLSLSGLSLARSVTPPRLQVGEEFLDTISVRNDSHASKLWVELIDRSNIPGHEGSRVISPRRKRTERWSLRFIAVKRGVFQLGPIEMRAGDPLAIFSRLRRFEVKGEIMVVPPLYDLPALRLPFADASGRSDIERRSMTVTPSVATVREYIPGDPLNKIAWAVTARTGKLMVKEFDVDPSSEIWIVADFARQVHIPAQRTVLMERVHRLDFAEAWFESSDDAVAALAGSVARLAQESRRGIGYIEIGGRQHLLQPDQGERALHRVLERLAVARPDYEESLVDVLLEEAHRFGRNRTPVVITTSLDERWPQALAEMANRGIRPIAIFVDPGSLDPGIESGPFVEALQEQRFPAFVVDFVEGIEAAFSWQPTAIPVPRNPALERAPLR